MKLALPLKAQPASASASASEPALATGDVVFRKEASLLSDLFAKASGTNGRYSHVGLVMMKAGKPEVAHVEERGVLNALQIVPLDDFLKNAERYSIYRLRGIGSTEEIESAVENAGFVRFDYQFSLDNDELYCTEFVYNILFGNSESCKCEVILLSTLMHRGVEISKSVP